MAEFDEKEKKIIVKIVYYGPALSGKTTNLMQLHDIVSTGKCGDLMTLETKGDRTLFFDLLPLIVKSANDYKIKIKLFTVPGQVAHDATRKAVLSRADAVVFIADSQVSQSMNNFQSFENLDKNAARVGINLDNLPLAIQFNKRDLKDVISEEEIMERWQATGLSITLASALYGKGVKETFKAILEKTYRKLDTLYKLKNRYLVNEEDFLSMIPS